MTLPGVGSSPPAAALAPSDKSPIEGVDDYYLTNITPNSPPDMKTLVYTPSARILIARNNREYDVSKDIVAVSVRRLENSVSSLVFKLANKPASEARHTDLRYNNLFERMDRVTCFLTRIKEIQVFTGYLDQVPLTQLYSGVVSFRASCSLKRLLYTYWDPGLPESSKIFDQAALNQLEKQNGETSLDAGLGSLLRRLLQEVGRWDSQHIHIQRFPLGYYRYMVQAIERTQNANQNAIREFRRMLLGDDTSLGTGAAAGRTLGTVRGPYVNVDRKMEVIRAVDQMGMGPDNMQQAAAQGVGTAAASGGNPMGGDEQRWKGVQQVGTNWNEAAQVSDAAIHCFMTIAVESNWMMWANNADPESLSFPHDAVGSDHDSIGLYQQRPSWGSTAQRMNVRESTCLFLQALNKLNWRNMDRGTACANVQNPRSDLRYKYGTMEQAAIEEVRQLRANGAANPGGAQSGVANQLTGVGPGMDPGSTPVVSTVTNGGIPAVPTTNGKVTTQAATAGTKPQFDLAGAMTFARTQIGKPYVWGGTGPDTYDCSGLMVMAYQSIGMKLERTTEAMLGTGTTIPFQNAQPGDLAFPNSGHVVMWMGDGKILHAPQAGDVVKEVPMYFNPATATWKHFPPAEFGGGPVGAYNPAPWGDTSGVQPGTVADGPAGGTTQVGSSEQLARNLYTYLFEPGKFLSTISMLFGGDNQPEKAFINDEALIHTIAGVATAGMRNFCSAPNGDFVAYYPDYFGLDGKNAVMDIEDIEMIDVHIDLNDDAMSTHVYVGGTPNPRGASMGVPGWLQSQGYITVENDWVFARMTAAAPHVKGERMYTGQQILKKFGCRPQQQEMPWLMQGPSEFLAAMQIFMTKWAQQYSTQIKLTFMPELFPGMRVRLVGHNLQAYITEVIHSGDYTNGFTTQATIMAPSTPAISRIANQLSDAFFTDRSDRLDIDNNASEWFY